MSIVVFLALAASMVVWSWWFTRLFFDTANHVRSVVTAAAMMLLFCGGILLPLFVVGWSVEVAFGRVTPLTQLAAIVLGPLPTFVFAVRHAHRWQRPRDHGSFKA